MRINSFAKVNLGLEVLGKRPDGYHDILTLFQAVDLADCLEMNEIPGDEILLGGNDPSIPWDETNLVHRAATRLRAETGIRKGVRIHAEKAIPAGKGLGGGSSNAAMTLVGLNELWGLDLDAGTLAGIGRTLGADIPYFLEGGFCLGRDRGDSLTPLPDLPELACVLIFPPFPVWTAEIYGAWKPSLTSCAKPSRIMRFLEDKNFGLLENELEETIFRRFPQLEEYKRFFHDQGAESSLVSGTGSTVFGLFSERAKAEKARRALRGEAPSVLAATLSRAAYRKRIRAGV